MYRQHRILSSLLLGAAFIIPALTTGCEHHYYRAYDPDHGDYHTWNNNEVGYYQQWENQNHYDHREFKERDRGQQKQYFDWRHNHEHDHDNERH